MPPESLFRSTLRRAPLGVACLARHVRCLLVAASLTALAACAAPAPVQVEERGGARRAASVLVSAPTKSPGKMPGAEAPTPSAPPWRSLHDAQPEPARPASGVDLDRDSIVWDSPTRTGAATGTVDWRATPRSPQPPQLNLPPSRSPVAPRVPAYPMQGPSAPAPGASAAPSASKASNTDAEQTAPTRGEAASQALSRDSAAQARASAAAKPPVIERSTTAAAPAASRAPIVPPQVLESLSKKPLDTSRPQTPATAAASRLGPPARQLLDKALAAQQRKNLAVAGGYLERALRIEPRSPLLHYHLARLRMAQNARADAAELAAKGLRHAPVNSESYIALKALMLELQATKTPSH